MGILLENINPVYFWDVRRDQLNESVSRKLIIERVFSLGSLREMNLVHDYYGEETIIRTLTSLAYIDPKTLNYISIKYNVPKSHFKCYKRKRSMKRFWD
jgi:hypothetical protein